MKYQDITSRIKMLLDQPSPVTLISNNLSCENLRDAIKNNFCTEIKYQLAQVFTSNIDKIFAMIQPAEIDKQVSQLLICIINSQPLEANIKNAASKLLIEWAPTFTQYMIGKFNARTSTN